MKNLLTEILMSRARKEFAQGVESFFMPIPVFGGLLIKLGNTYQKATIPVTLQRNSEERDETDVYRTHFLQKDSTGKYRGYRSVAANLGNILFMPTKSFTDCFGNKITAWEPLQANGNTLLVLLTNILNGKIDIPRDYTINDFIPDYDEELKFEIIFVNSLDEYEALYETIDNSASGKSKSDNYTSVLGGFGLLDVTTGKSDLVKWTQTDMDRPLGLIDNCPVPKKVQDMAKTFSQYQDIIKNVDPRTSSIIKYSHSWNAVFRALCLDMTSLHLKGEAPYYDEFLDELLKKIDAISDGDVLQYWQDNLSFGKTKKSNIISQMSDKDISKWMMSDRENTSVFKLRLNVVDWILWELFAVDSADWGHRNVRVRDVYVKGGNDILGGKSRGVHMYKLLNILRMAFIYSMKIGIEKVFTLNDLFDWATVNLGVNLANIENACDLEKIGSVAKKGRTIAPRVILKEYIYS